MRKGTVGQTIDAYNKNADKYAKKFNNYEIYRNRISDFQKKFIPHGTHILDLGCGPGNNIKTLHERDNTCSFTGVDLSSEFVKISKQRFPQFDFYEQDIRNLKLKTSFEVVIASFCIVHLTDAETHEFIRNVSKSILQNGYFYLSYMNGDKSGFETTSFSKDQIFFNYYTDEFILDILHQHNLRILEISKEEYRESDGSITIDTFIYAKKT